MRALNSGRTLACFAFPGKIRFTQPPQCLMFTCSPIVLPPAGRKRESPRRSEERPTGYQDEFDDSTLFYDVIRTHHNGLPQFTAIGPPLFNLYALWSEARLDGRAASSLISMSYLRDRCCDLWVEYQTAEQVEVCLPCASFRVHVQAAMPELYRNKRVLYTLSKNNHITWIVDWARFHAANHGANAVLLYDNGSTLYSAGDLEQALRSALSGMEVNVVAWPYKYGPQGFTPFSGWDSDFCQYGAFHDARFRFLTEAASVLNCDIDELVVSMRGSSIFEATEADPYGYIPFIGGWIANALPAMDPLEGSGPRRLRHEDYKYLELAEPEELPVNVPGPHASPPKWCVVPGKCDLSQQWRTHDVSGMPYGDTSNWFSYRHFRAVSTSWKYPRAICETVDLSRHRFDDVLASGMQRMHLAMP